jgi:ACS family hexuronate transporter-like MFS transporter
MGIAAVLLPLSPLIYSAPTPLMAVLIAAVAAFAHLSWQISLSTIILDVFPKPLLGTVFGVVAAGSGFGGMLSANLIGRAITSWSYAPVFLVMGCLHPLAYVMLQLVRPKKVKS